MQPLSPLPGDGQYDTDPIYVGPFIIGSVDAINGDGAEVLPAVRVTRHEAKILADYWHTEAEGTFRECQANDCIGSAEWRTIVHGWARAAQLKREVSR